MIPPWVAKAWRSLPNWARGLVAIIVAAALAAAVLTGRIVL